MGAPVAQGFGILGLQVAERHQALASFRRRATFPTLWRTKKTKRTERPERSVSDHDVSTAFDAGAVSAREPKMPLPTGARRPFDLAGRRVYSRTAERYWILRSGDDELRFTPPVSGRALGHQARRAGHLARADVARREHRIVPAG